MALDVGAARHIRVHEDAGTLRGSGYVTRFEVRKSFLDNYEGHQVGGQSIRDYGIPAEDLPALNPRFVARIEFVAVCQ